MSNFESPKETNCFLLLNKLEKKRVTPAAANLFQQAIPLEFPDCEMEVRCFFRSFISDEELEILYKICEDNLKHMYDKTKIGWSKDDKKEELSHQHARFILIKRKDTNEIVGFSHFRIDMDYGREVLYCYELQVKAAYQRRGLGFAMLQIEETLAAAFKMSKIVLTVLKTNPTITFYYKHRFVIDETSPRGKKKCDYLILSKKIGKTQANSGKKKIAKS